jgi:hypothetical protein
MATDTAAPQATYDEWRTRRWRLTSLTFALLWLVVAVSVGFIGEKRSDLATLEGGIADGSVTKIEIVGYHDYAGSRARTRVTLVWRGTVVPRYADVEVDTRRNPGRADGRDGIVGPPTDYLRTFDADLDIAYSEPESGASLGWRDWRAPGWTAFLGLVTWFGTVLLAGNGPEPWRATKWAWTWLTLIGGPVGCLAFFLLGGPAGLWRPQDPGRRLTGGWAFLVALVLGGAAD